MMGWWKPYFFWDVTGVQVLIPSLTITGPSSFVGISLLIAILCFLDRYLSNFYNSSSSSTQQQQSQTNNNNRNIIKEVSLYSLQRFLSGLIMLIMMSFNIILYLEVISFFGISELYCRIRKQRQQHHLNNYLYETAVSDEEYDNNRQRLDNIHGNSSSSSSQMAGIHEMTTI